jgi:hypothetical protein
MHPARRWLVFLSAAIAAVLAVVLPATLASASMPSAARNGVGASHSGMIFTIEADHSFSPGEGRCVSVSQAGFAGSYVAAEDD